MLNEEISDLNIMGLDGSHLSNHILLPKGKPQFLLSLLETTESYRELLILQINENYFEESSAENILPSTYGLGKVWN